MLWTKIIISIIAVGITIIEVWEFRKRKKNKKWEKLKRPLIVGCSLTLLLLTVWNDIAEENGNLIEEQRRNEQIVKDSIRATQIILNLGNALEKIDSSTQNLAKVDSSIGVVKDVLNEQVSSLTHIVSESEEIQNNLTGGNSYLKFFLIKSGLTQRLELHCTVMGKYPMHNISINVGCTSFRDSLINKPIKLEPLVYGNGTNRSFEVKFSSLTSNIRIFEIAKFESDDFKGDINLNIWTYSNNGSTFQKISWKHHREYLSSPRKTNKTSLMDKNTMDWSGSSFEYSSNISRVTPTDKRDEALDRTAGVFYDETQGVQLNLFDTLLILYF